MHKYAIAIDNDDPKKSSAATPRLIGQVTFSTEQGALLGDKRIRLLEEIERRHDELDVPIFCVRHALDEVSRLADHLVLLEAGHVLASGSLGEITARLDLPLAQDDDASAELGWRHGGSV